MVINPHLFLSREQVKKDHSKMEVVVAENDLSEVLVHRFQVDMLILVNPAKIFKILVPRPCYFSVLGELLSGLLSTWRIQEDFFPSKHRLVNIGIVELEGEAQFVERAAHLTRSSTLHFQTIVDRILCKLS